MFATKLNELYEQYLRTGGSRENIIELSLDNAYSNDDAFRYHLERFPWLTEDDLDD